MEELDRAYKTAFVGDAAEKFREYIIAVDSNLPDRLYAKAICVLQSSGTGKSRMLTEVRMH